MEIVNYDPKVGHFLSNLLTDYSMSIIAISVIIFAVYKALLDRQHGVISVVIFRKP